MKSLQFLRIFTYVFLISFLMPQKGFSGPGGNPQGAEEIELLGGDYHILNEDSEASKHEVRFISEEDFKQKKFLKMKKRDIDASRTFTGGAASGAVVLPVIGVLCGAFVGVAASLGTMGAPVVAGGLVYGGYKLYKHTRKKHILLTSEERKFLTEESQKKGDDSKETIHLVVERILDNLCTTYGYSGGVSDLTLKDEKKTSMSSFLKKEKYLTAYNDQGGVQKYRYLSKYPHILLHKYVVCRTDNLSQLEKKSQSPKIGEYLTLLKEKAESEVDPDENSTRQEFEDVKSDIAQHPDKYQQCRSHT